MKYIILKKEGNRTVNAEREDQLYNNYAAAHRYAETMANRNSGTEFMVCEMQSTVVSNRVTTTDHREVRAALPSPSNNNQWCF